MVRAGRAEHESALGVQWLDGIIKHMVQVHTSGPDVLYVKGDQRVRAILGKLTEPIGQRSSHRQYLARVSGG